MQGKFAYFGEEKQALQEFDEFEFRIRILKMPVINTLKDIPVFKKLKKRTDLGLILNVYILVFS